MERARESGNLSSILAGFNSGALQHAFAESTNASQKSAVKAWQSFCFTCNFGWSLIGLNLDEVTNILLSYISFEIGLREMKPSSIEGSYLSHINNYFTTSRIKNEFWAASKSNIVRLILRGYERIYYAMYPINGSRKFAFTIELVNHLSAAVAKYKPGWLLIKDLVDMLQLAMVFGIYFLLRKSEFLPCQHERSPNGIAWSCINFFDKDGRIISWDSIEVSKAKTIQIKIGKSKTDQSGIGRIRMHQRVDGKQCIVRKVAIWAKHCRMHYGMNEQDYLFRKKGQEALINDATVSLAMKFIVQLLGWETTKVSPHSLRYGGATMLAAAGLPQYDIEYFGGWAQGSKSLRVYAQQLGSEAVTRVSRIMSSGFEMSLEESRIRAFANAL